MSGDPLRIGEPQHGKGSGAVRLRRGHTLHEGIDGQGEPESLHRCGCRWKDAGSPMTPRTGQEGEAPHSPSPKLQEI